MVSLGRKTKGFFQRKWWEKNKFKRMLFLQLKVIQEQAVLVHGI